MLNVGQHLTSFSIARYLFEQKMQIFLYQYLYLEFKEFLYICERESILGIINLFSLNTKTTNRDRIFYSSICVYKKDKLFNIYPTLEHECSQMIKLLR